MQTTETWTPHPGAQTRALERGEFEVLYGGARGGGKTDAGLAWLLRDITNPKYRALVLRKNYEDLTDWLDRAGKMYTRYGGQITGKPATIKFPSGALIRTGHLKDRKSYEKYLGHEYQRQLIEELTLIPEERYYVEILGSCRSTIPELRPQVFATTNPGNIGHLWVKQRFVDPAPAGTPFLAEDTGRYRIFVPSTVDDNPTLVKNDPFYVNMLDGLKKTSEELWRAWRLGDWDIFVGQAFGEFRRDRHVVDKLGYPLELCDKIIGFDWGYNAPGCAVWLAYDPNGHVWAYRELYQTKRNPEQWAKDILNFTRHEKVQYMVLPHDCFSKLGGWDSIASIFERHKVAPIMRGSTQERGARHVRKALMHRYLADHPDGSPYLRFVAGTTPNVIRTIPSLVIDEHDLEDIDTDGEDHGYDATSLAIMSKHKKRAGGDVSVRPKSNRDLLKLIRTPEMNEAGEFTSKAIIDKTKRAYTARRKRKTT